MTPHARLYSLRGPDLQCYHSDRLKCTFELAISIALGIFYVKLHLRTHARRNSIGFKAAGYSRVGPDSTGI